MASIEEKEIGVVGYRPEAKEGCCWWTCNDQLSCSDPRREENWDGPAVRASLESWSKEKNLNLTKKKKKEFRFSGYTSSRKRQLHHYKNDCPLLSPPEWSGAGERQGVEGPGERLCVGEPERLSLDDWWNPEEKLRLLCMGGGGVCLDSFFKMLRRLLQK